MKKINLIGSIIVICFFLFPNVATSQTNEYINRFTTLRNKIKDPSNGYFSKDGVPYHSVESLICEAPDHGHETTSEAYSYWIWLEAMQGRVAKDWAPLNSAWTKMETLAIPTNDLQPTAGAYKPNAPATYASEFPLPSNYPSPLQTSVPVGQDPVSPELTATYGNSFVYGMHWLFDLDNFYGYGNKGDGVSTPSYINTFQRGVQESVWETVPQPTWDDFKWGKPGSGFLNLFTSDPNPPSKQWKYTNAPDADARVVQAMYWATLYAKEQGLNPATVMPLGKTKKMGDYLRLAMFDKYFKPMGVQNVNGAGGTGYQSAHYLLAWYYAWGGPLTENGWAWRIGCSHSHFGYQNPVAAYALSAVPELIPASPNASRDWGTSLTRQMEFYQWLQSAEGAIAGGATNSWNGKYDPYPAGTPTFYNMAYVENPVYEDPGSNTWFGMQAWSMERVAEYYYMTGNARAKTILDKWVTWVKSVTRLLPNGSYEIPAEIGWTGKPNTWTPASPTVNTGLHVTVVTYNQDVGIAACLAKALTYYAAGTQKHATLDVASRDLAKAILDRMWTNFYEPTGKGVAAAETRTDFRKFFEQEVYIPAGWTGTMPNGDVIQPGVKFIDIRSKYKQDPDWARLQAAYTAGTGFTQKYHRFWAQADVALANAEYGYFFGGGGTVNVPPTVSLTAPANNASFTAPASITITASAADSDGTVASVQFFNGTTLLGTDATAPYSFTWAAVPAGTYTLTAVATDNVGAATTSVARTVTVTGGGGNLPPTVSLTAPANNATFTAPASITITATAADSDGTVANVQFFNGTTLLGSDATAPYSFTWTAVPAGTYTITARATDNIGAMTTSTARTITVTGGGNIPPTVSITAPANNATFTAPASITITANAADTDGTVANVQFFNGATLLGSDATAPYSFTWAGVGVGTYTITARATDNAGASTTSTAITVTVTSGGGTSCAFGTPLAAGLPSTNASYNRVHKLGTGGPNLSNVTNFTINWNLQQNGLWQLSFNTNNGNPTWWLDLRSVSTTRFNVAQPDITFTNSGFPGLDGSYYVGLHNGNFVLASKTGGFTLYFSNSATPPVCTSARLGAEEMANMNAVSAFPNPFSEVFNISIEKPELVKALSIHDQVGRLVVNVPREEIKSNVEIRQPMRKGLYILKVQSIYGSQTIKIIKE